MLKNRSYLPLLFGFGLFLSLLLEGCTDSFSQKYYDLDLLKVRLLSPKQAALFEQEIAESTKNAAIHYFLIADSLAKKGDSINSSAFFLKVDPYYLLFKTITPATIDTYLANRLNLSKTVREKYKVIFNKAWLSKKSFAYEKFKRMVEEDYYIRDTLNRCMDSRSFSRVHNQMLQLDSMHFAYLHNYLQTNGWPSLKNGGLYAGLIAIHDYNNSDKYLSALKLAASSEGTYTDIIKLFLYKKGKSKGLIYYDSVLARNEFVGFDISSVLNNKIPASLHQIVKIVKENCPVKLIITEEFYDEKIPSDWFMKIPIGREFIVWQMLNHLADSMCEKNEKEIAWIKDLHWHIGDVIPDYYWPWLDTTKIKVKLYVLCPYSETTSSFNKLITDKKFVTHAINFDVDKSTIKPESIDFLARLADWLKQNPAVSLEINGHTDSDGDPAANLKLSQARAEEVKKQLVANGIATSRLTTKGFGDTKPIDLNNTEPGKANNRRVEFIKQ